MPAGEGGSGDRAALAQKRRELRKEFSSLSDAELVNVFKAPRGRMLKGIRQPDPVGSMRRQEAINVWGNRDPVNRRRNERNFFSKAFSSATKVINPFLKAGGGFALVGGVAMSQSGAFGAGASGASGASSAGKVPIATGDFLTTTSSGRFAFPGSAAAKLAGTGTGTVAGMTQTEMAGATAATTPSQTLAQRAMGFLKTSAGGEALKGAGSLAAAKLVSGSGPTGPAPAAVPRASAYNQAFPSGGFSVDPGNLRKAQNVLESRAEGASISPLGRDFALLESQSGGIVNRPGVTSRNRVPIRELGGAVPSIIRNTRNRRAAAALLERRA